MADVRAAARGPASTSAVRDGRPSQIPMPIATSHHASASAASESDPVALIVIAEIAAKPGRLDRDQEHGPPQQVLELHHRASASRISSRASGSSTTRSASATISAGPSCERTPTRTA